MENNHHIASSAYGVNRRIVNRRKSRRTPLLMALFAAVLVTITFGPGERRAYSATNDVFAIACSTAIHVADFTTCVSVWESQQGKTGLVVASSPTIPATALMQVTGPFTQSCPHGLCVYVGGGYKPVMPDGTPLTTDADLLTTDNTLYGTLRGTTKPTSPIKIPPAYGYSPINNEAWAADANTAINIQVSGAAGLAIGTTVMVTWPDGTTAQFVRSNSVPTVLWVYIPGSMKNAEGNPITPVTGVEISNPHAGQGGSGSGVLIPGSPFDLNLIAGSTCTGTVTVTIPGDATYVYVFYLPC